MSDALDEDAVQAFEEMSGDTPAETQDETGYNPNEVQLLEIQLRLRE